MADYINSFNKGINVAKTAERDKIEIDTIFEEMNRQLSRASDDKIAIERKQYDVLIDDLEPGASLPNFLMPNKYCTLVAKFLPNNAVLPIEIAQWHQDATGYPCRLTFGSNSYTCENATALEEMLTLLLSDATVGEALRNFMMMPAPEPQR